MTASSVLDFHLGKAIRAEVKKEVDLLRRDLELDRQMRIQLEEQVSALQRNAADVMRWLSDPSKMAAAAGEQSAQRPSTLPEDALMEEMISADLKALFGKYNDRSKTGLAGKDFTKLCLDAALVDRIDADLIFSNIMGTARRMDFEHFEVALERVAEKKNKAVANLRKQLARLPGPNLNDITVPDDVRLHDDQTTYTGTFSQQQSRTPQPQRQESVTNRTINELWRNELRTEQAGMQSRESRFHEGQSSKSYPKYALVPAGLQTPPTESPKAQTRNAMETQKNERRTRFGMPAEDTPPTSPLPMEITQLAQDIDRKVGAVLQDIDQRLEAAQAYSDRVASAAAGAATDHSKALFSALTKRLDVVCSQQDESLASIRTAETHCATLQKRGDLLGIELDELRLHVGLTVRGQRALVLPPEGRFLSAPASG